MCRLKSWEGGLGPPLPFPAPFALTMSLGPKIDEVISFVEDSNNDLVCITETWLTDLVSINYLQIPTFNLIFKIRSCLCITNFIKYNILEERHVPDYEILWIRVSPTRLLQGFSSIIISTVYRPPSADNKSMLEYQFKPLTEIEGQYPNYGLLLAGDFNHLDIRSLVRHFKVKLLVHLPMRNDQTLDLNKTNLFLYYSSDSLTIHPPFKLSTIILLLYTQKKDLSTPTSLKKGLVGKENWGDIYVLELANLDTVSSHHQNLCDIFLVGIG